MNQWLNHYFLPWAEILAAAVGLVYLIARRRRCPRAAWTGAAGLALFLAYCLPWMTPWPGPGWVQSVIEWFGADKATTKLIAWWVTPGVRTVCYLLLAWAVVIGRRSAGEPDDADGDEE